MRLPLSAVRHSLTLSVLLQAMKEDPPLDARCRDKFLVQSVAIDSTDESNVASLWSGIEKTAKSSIQEQKIRVQFLPAGADVTSTPAATSRGLSADEQPPAYSSPTPVYGSPAPASDAKSPSMSTSTKSTANSTAESAQSSLAGAAATITNIIPTNQQELQAQLDAAKARISDLTNQLSDPQLRQRKIAETQEKVQTVIQQSQDSGVPLHITAALCLLSFIIAWAFF